MYELFHKKAPFKGRRVEEVKQKIKENKMEFKKDLKDEWKKLIKLMLQIDPKKRPNVNDILSIRFIKEFTDKLSNNTSQTSQSGPKSNPMLYSNEKQNKDSNQNVNPPILKTFKKQNNQKLKYEEISDKKLIIENNDKDSNVHSIWGNKPLKTSAKTIENNSKTKFMGLKSASLSKNNFYSIKDNFISNQSNYNASSNSKPIIDSVKKGIEFFNFK